MPTTPQSFVIDPQGVELDITIYTDAGVTEATAYTSRDGSSAVSWPLTISSPTTFFFASGTISFNRNAAPYYLGAAFNGVQVASDNTLALLEAHNWGPPVYTVELGETAKELAALLNASGGGGGTVDVTVGSTTTGAAGSDAAVANSGTSTHVVLDFTIPRGDTGAAGADGADGATGPAGADGATGATGAAGAAGTNGATWRTGSGAPSNGTGVDGDLYLNTANGDVYKRASGTYSVIANITGPTGATGSAGAAGAKGDTGNTGATGAAGTNGPDVFAYTFSTTTTDADPGADTLRFNNATLASVTKVYISKTGPSSVNIDSILAALAGGASLGGMGILELFSAANPTTKFAIFAVTGVTNATGYRKLDVIPMVNGGNLPSTTASDTIVSFRWIPDPLILSTANIGTEPLIIWAGSTKRFSIFGDGSLGWYDGVGGETFMYSPEAAVLAAYHSAFKNELTSTVQDAYRVRLDGESFDRFKMLASGKMGWGAATLDLDTFLERESAAKLKVTSDLHVTGDLTVDGAAPSYGLFGDASDGVVTFDGTTTVLGFVPSSNAYTLNRDIYLADGSALTGSAVIKTGGYRIFCAGTLTIGASAAISGDGGAANGATAGTTQGSGTLGSGGNGGNGGSNVTGVAGGAASNGIGGAGGAGGANSGGPGAGGGTAGGAASAPPTTAGLPHNAVDAILGRGAIGGAGFRGGGGGSGGNSVASSTSGGGGAGGCVVGVYAVKLINNGAITSKGGTGANASGSGTGAGGGGGGGGGVVMVVCGTGSTVGTRTVTGGNGGTLQGAGKTGVTGSAGQTFTMNV